MSNWNKRSKQNWYNKLPPKVNTTNKEISNYQLKSRFGYIGYEFYFSETDPTKAQAILAHVKTFESYIQRNNQQFNLKQICESMHFRLNVELLFNDTDFMGEWETFKQDLFSLPELTINSLALAMHQVAFVAMNEENESFPLCMIHCRIQNYEPILQIKHLRANRHGKLVTIRGTIIKASTISLQCMQIEFKCSFCNGTQVQTQVDGIYALPEKCATRGCKATRQFQPLVTSKNTLTISSQSLKLQELVGEEIASNGRMPRTIECEVCNELVGVCVPGDDVILTGVLHVKNLNNAKTGFRKSAKVQQSIYQLFLKVNNVQNDRTHSLIKLSVQDNDVVEKIRAEPYLFRFLVQSLCPNIYGHEIVKAGLLLALFGGTKSNSFQRCDSHVLIVGDPGLGKSQMLQACCNVAPRGVYVCGNMSTNSGLTVTMTKESSGEYRLEAGALVLADQGCCCIDEFDKMQAEHACLLEVMEQQSISIAKAGVTCTVPTRASVLAAANPICGHYNKAKTVSENLKISSPLLSRFDLVFIILDKPNDELTAMLSEHVLAIRSGEKPSYYQETVDNLTEDPELSNRLLMRTSEEIDHLPAALFRKYIAYAKQHVHPQLSADANLHIERFYLELRKQYHKDDSTPVTARQLESLIRLTQARAKLELRQEATVQDAMDVVDVMRHCIMDIFTDNMGTLDFTRPQNGVGVSNRKLVTKYLKELKEKSETLQKNMFDFKELKAMATNVGIPAESFYSLFESINLQGYLLKKGKDRFQLTICE